MLFDVGVPCSDVCERVGKGGDWSDPETREWSLLFAGRGLTLEALLIRYVKDQQDTHGSSVVGSSDGTESFLSCCVPLKRRQKEDGECMECQ